MYSTKNAIILSFSDIKRHLRDYDIYAHYLGKFQVGKLYNSPLRTNDKIPSFAVFPARNGNLLFKDHGSGQTGTAYTFVKLMENINDDSKLLQKLTKILNTVNPSIKAQQFYINTNSYNTHFGIVRQEWTDFDIKYWAQYGITLETLKKYDVFSIKYFLQNNIVRGIYTEENPMYAYKVNDKFKIYRPLASKYTKWRSNLTNSDIQGLHILPPKGDILIITKSLKDVMVLHEMGYDAISPSSETTFIPQDILDNIVQQFKRVYILFDRDKTGVKRTRELSKKYNIEGFFINKRFKAKDISDAVMLNGFNVIKTWLDNTLKQ